MRDRAWKGLPWLALAVAVGVGVLLVGGGPEGDPVGGGIGGESAAELGFPDRAGGSKGTAAGEEGGEAEAHGGFPDRGGGAPGTAKGAAAVYREYIGAINGLDGELLCGLVGEPAVERLGLPVSEGGCARRLRESIGYRDPRGYPVWEETTLASIDSVDLKSGGQARITATIVTSFADRDEASVETDVAYLEEREGSWRFAKPSLPIYRAIGNPDPPPGVIAAP